MSERDASPNMPDPDPDAVPDGETPGGPLGEIQPDDEDTSGGPLSSGAGGGAGRGGPDVDVPGGSSEGIADDEAIGGGGERFEG